jgi:hypothetical protein
VDAALADDPIAIRPWLHGVSLDDQLWHQALVGYRQLEEIRVTALREDERVLYQLLRRGLMDHTDFDKRWDGSTRSMRHSASIGGRLWAMLREERERVRRRDP